MERILQFLRRVRNHLFGRVVDRTPQPRTSLPRARNDAPQFAEDLVLPRHAADEIVRFQQIGRSGMLLQSSEEWHREGNALRTTLRRTMVVTCSRAVVAPERIGSVCSVCGGFEEGIHRCSACGQPVCHLHVRRFRSSRFCPPDYRRAVLSWNLWTEPTQSKVRLIPPPRKPL